MATPTLSKYPTDESKKSSSSKYKYSIEPANSISSKNSYRILPFEGEASRQQELNRLEVETASTTSIPLSLPYYYIAHAADSFDTVNLFAAPNRPNYLNTSHVKSSSGEDLTGKRQAQTQGGDDGFNPVPKRFSQFIIDQKNPFTAQRLDNLSLASSNDLEVDMRRTNSLMRRRNITHSIQSSSKSKSTPSTNQYHFGRTLTNASSNISNSMDSQATIFSTRQGLSLESGRNRTFLRKSKTKARLYTTDSDTSSLTRRRAIRFKKGSWLYRLKLRLEKMVARMKQMKFRNFKVSSKRTYSTRKSSLSKSYKPLQKLRFKNPEGVRQGLRSQISAPSNNPNLGQGKVQTVRKLDDDLKYMAGAPEDSLVINGPRKGPSGDLKLNHLSSYIDQQHNSYSETSKHRFSSKSDLTANTMFSAQNKTADTTREYHDSLDPGRKVSKADSDISAESTPPIPPPHNEYTFSELEPHDTQDEVIDLWKSYLSHVLCKRIQLRQEISLFQTFLLDQDKNGFKIYEDKEAVDEKEKEFNPESKDIESTSEFKDLRSTSESIIESKSSWTESEFSLSDTFELDSTAEKFQAQYNRRSVLGDMLDYDSESELTASSEQYTASYSESVISDIGVQKRYGTIKRGKSINEASPVPTMKRSTGFQSGLSNV